MSGLAAAEILYELKTIVVLELTYIGLASYTLDRETSFNLGCSSTRQHSFNFRVVAVDCFTTAMVQDRPFDRLNLSLIIPLFYE